jgi:hypothetical protein
MLVYSEYYEQLGILVKGSNLVRITDGSIFIPFTDKWVVIDNNFS